MDKSHLYSQLVRLGDLMGDGEHLEPGGKWISKEYNQVVKALGIKAPRKKANNTEINQKMMKRVLDVKCECSGALKQTRSGSRRAVCLECGNKYQLLKRSTCKN